ncbi:MAG: glycoside hydrolase family 20 zincin-like fold domain-containing protein, partial [Bryobacteraceae bacterium]
MQTSLRRALFLIAMLPLALAGARAGDASRTATRAARHRGPAKAQAVQAASGFTIPVIPLPASTRAMPGEFIFTAKTHISAARGTEAVAEQLRDALRPAMGYPLPVARGGSNHVSLALDKKLKRLGPEGYRLEIKKNSISIRSTTTAGIFYGVQTLR